MFAGRYVDPDTLSWKILRPFRLRKRKPVSKVGSDSAQTSFVYFPS